MAGKLYLGMDLGATTLSAALLDESGSLHGFRAEPTPEDSTAEELAAAVVAVARRLLEEQGVALADLTDIGAAAAGPVNQRTRVVHIAPNLWGPTSAPLGDLLQAGLGRPVALANDAAVAALAEARAGAGQGAGLVLYVMLGTGVGGGIVLHGRAVAGASGLAGEFGHGPLLPDGPVCGCGRTGCLESVASGKAIGEAGRRLVAVSLQQGMHSPLTAAASEGPVTARTVAAAALAGDDGAARILQRAGRALGRGLAVLVNTLNPDRVVLGGGLTLMPRELMLAYAEQELQLQALAPAAADAQIVIGQLREKAGAMGAAFNAMP